MDKLKQSFSRSKNDEPEDTSGASGKLTGQGSHFRSVKESTGFGSTTTDAARDTPAADYAPVAAQGPEAGGDKHVGTIDPSTLISTGGSEPSQAVGQTSTYSSTPLTKGDPTPSVIDPESSDPMSYQKPEASYGGTGVPEGAASIAASKAFSSTPEVMPGSYPSQNKSSSDEPTSDFHSTGVDASGANTAAILATTGAAPSPQAPSSTADTSGTVPSTLTSTTSPGERLAEYRDAEKPRGLDSTSATTSDQSHPTMVGRVLGAVGLGSLAGAGAAKAASGRDESAVTEASEQRTTTTGFSSQIVPEQSGPPSHHRKESIPTTAYPAGLGSPRPVAPPVGGTQPQDRNESEDQSRSRDAAIGTAALGGAGALGVGAFAARDRDQSKSVADDTTIPSAVTAPSESARAGAYTTSSSTQQQEPVSTLRERQPEPASTTTTEPEKEDHTTRNVAAAGAAGIGAGAVGAYATHEYSQRQAAEEEATRRATEQKELARQQAARQRELEEQQKAAEKAAAKEEKQHQKEIEKHEKAVAKEEKQHQKELEKEEKKHQKEVEKAEKKHEKEVAAAQKEREEQEALERKRAEQAEEEERKRREKEAATAAGVGVAGAGYVGSRDKEPKGVVATYKEPADGGEVEKKPSLLKRMFKRTRKNKDTGEDEEYEEEGDDDDSHKGAYTAAGVEAGAAAGGAAYYASRDSEKPTGADPSDKSYGTQSEGLQKPSYNQLSKDDPTTSSFTGATSQGRTGEKVPYETEPVPGTTTSTAGKTTDSTPAAVANTSTQKTTKPTTTASSTIPAPGEFADTHDPTSDKPIEPVTGLPYDPAKDPAAAKRIEEQRHGAMGLMLEAQKQREERGEGGDVGESGSGPGDGEKKSLGTRIKEKLHLGHGAGEEDGHGHHGQ